MSRFSEEQLGQIKKGRRNGASIEILCQLFAAKKQEIEEVIGLETEKESKTMTRYSKTDKDVLFRLVFDEGMNAVEAGRKVGIAEKAATNLVYAEKKRRQWNAETKLGPVKVSKVDGAVHMTCVEAAPEIKAEAVKDEAGTPEKADGTKAPARVLDLAPELAASQTDERYQKSLTELKGRACVILEGIECLKRGIAAFEGTAVLDQQSRDAVQRIIDRGLCVLNELQRLRARMEEL